MSQLFWQYGLKLIGHPDDFCIVIWISVFIIYISQPRSQINIVQQRTIWTECCSILSIDLPMSQELYQHQSRCWYVMIRTFNTCIFYMYILYKKENKKVKQIYLVLLGNQTYRGSMHINGVVHIADDRTKDPSEKKMKFLSISSFYWIFVLEKSGFPWCCNMAAGRNIKDIHLSGVKRNF